MRVTTVVIGAGHCGLAMSRCLSERSIDHVVLERGQVADSWRTRWDSLRLLTPNWQSRLPGFRYEGAEPDGYMTASEVVDHIGAYATHIDAPMQTETTVTSVACGGDGYVVTTDQGQWTCRSVVVATGACSLPNVPEIAEAVPPTVTSITPSEYRNPDQLADGGVLIAGAGATGIQLADEIHRSGRPVTLSVGGHVRAPRLYRGMDIMWWLDAAGVLDERWDEVDDVDRVRWLPSFQLVGTPERSTIDLARLQRDGVRCVGRFAGIRDRTAQFSGALRNVVTLADLKLGRLLDTIDEWATENGLDDESDPPHRFEPTPVADSPPLTIDLDSGEIRTIIWATGYRPHTPWLDIPVLDRKGRIRHDGGVTELPGLYAMGLPFLRRRKSTLIDGAGDDASDLADHLISVLAGQRHTATARDRLALPGS